MSDNKLYDYNYEYKEQHTSHLTRPALVAIRKPLLQTTEMEDVLIRLLNLHVPAVEDTAVYEIGDGGLGARALLFTYKPTNEKVTGENIIRDTTLGQNYNLIGVERITNRRNLYLSYTTEDAYGSIQNILAGEKTRDYDKFPANTDIDADIITTKKVIGDFEYVEQYGQNVKFTGSISYEPKLVTPTDEVIRYDLYILNTDDHKYLNADKNTKQSTNTDLLARSNWFYLHNVPCFIDTEIIYSPKDQYGKTHKLSNKQIKKALGYIPKNDVSTYHWRFYLPSRTKLEIKEATKDREGNWVKPNTDNSGVNKKNPITFPELIKKLNDYYEAGPKAPHLVDQQSSGATLGIAPSTQSLIKTIGGLIDYLTKAKLPTEYVTKVSYQMNELKQLLQLPNSPKKIAGKTYADVYKTNIEQQNALIERIRMLSYVYTTCTMLVPTTWHYKNTGELMREAIDEFKNGRELHYFPLLDEGLKTYDSVMATVKSVQKKFIKPKTTTKVNYGTFLYQYYSVLINRVSDKYNSLKPFTDSGVVRLAFQDSFDVYKKHLVQLTSEQFNTLPETTADDSGDKWYESKLGILNKMEEFLFSPFSGFFITSYTEGATSNKLKDIKIGSSEVKSAIWNSLADTEQIPNFINANGDKTLSDLNTDLKYDMLNNQNKDVNSIHLERVTSGMSTATIVIKNANQKYNYKNDRPLLRTTQIFEPMDEIFVFLPTTHTNKNELGIYDQNQGELEQVFTGIIRSVTADNRSGYNNITLTADCMKKRLNISRTNTKPSITRAESGKTPITVFDMPLEFYKTVEKWMTFILAQATTNIFCQPQHVTKDNIGKALFTDNSRAALKTKVTYTVTKSAGLYDVPVVKKYDITPKQTGLKYDKNGQLEIQIEAVKEYKPEGKLQETVNEKQLLGESYEERRRTITIGYRHQVKFVDPLFTYLWYRSNSISSPIEETNDMKSCLNEVLKDYVKTSYYADGGLKESDGALDFKTLLRAGKRASYNVYQSRYNGLVVKYDERGKAKVRDRILTATLLGSSQPVYDLRQTDFSIQFSNYKTNMEIINEVLNRFNFICYTDKNGIIRITPYNFDLTTLNTNKTTNKLETETMYITHSLNDFEKADNFQVLREQYMINYRKTDNDRNLVNWLNLNGNWVTDASTNNWTRIVVKDPVLIKKYGYRSGRTINILGIQDASALALYGLAWMDRQNKKFRSATATCLFDSRMDVNLPYYVPTDEVIYYCSGLSIDYKVGETCICTMQLDYGRKPIIPLEKPNRLANDVYVPNISTIQNYLDDLFIKHNEIKPTTYSQYYNIFEKFRVKTIEAFDSEKTPVKTQGILPFLREENVSYIDRYIYTTAPEEIKKYSAMTAVCCFNGYVWDNVAGISFEELVYNYAWLSAGINVGGFVTAMSNRTDDSKLMESLSEYLSVVSDWNMTNAAKEIIRTYFIDVPAINDKSKSPIFNIPNHEDTLFDDLDIPGIVDVKNPSAGL